MSGANNRFVRASKVRHVYGETAKPQFHFTDLRLSPLAGDQQHIKANDLYFAVPVSRGSITVLPLNTPGKCAAILPMLDGHKGKTVDFDFSPFHTQLIATGGDDSALKLWRIPAGGLVETLNEPIVDMDSAHQKKVTVVRFNPTIDNLCATGSSDYSLKLWDVSQGESDFEFPLNEMVQDVVWNYYGTLLATSTKDKLMSLIDPRAGKSCLIDQVEAHDGTKPCRIAFLGESQSIATVGFSKSSVRSFKLWDQRKGLKEPFSQCNMDQSAGAMMPFYDEALNILYVGGKGDTNVRYFEITDEIPFYYKIDEFRTTRPCKGMCMLPKRCVDVMQHETSRFLRLTTDSVEPVTFYCPRKSDLFQLDIYPPCPSGRPSATAEEFMKDPSLTILPDLASMDPADGQLLLSGTKDDSEVSQIHNGNGALTNGSIKVKSKREIEADLEEAKSYISLLTEKLNSEGIKVPEPPKSLQLQTQTE